MLIEQGPAAPEASRRLSAEEMALESIGKQIWESPKPWSWDSTETMEAVMDYLANRAGLKVDEYSAGEIRAVKKIVYGNPALLLLFGEAFLLHHELGSRSGDLEKWLAETIVAGSFTCGERKHCLVGDLKQVMAMVCSSLTEGKIRPGALALFTQTGIDEAEKILSDMYPIFQKVEGDSYQIVLPLFMKEKLAPAFDEFHGGSAMKDFNRQLYDWYRNWLGRETATSVRAMSREEKIKFFSGLEEMRRMDVPRPLPEEEGAVPAKVIFWSLSLGIKAILNGRVPEDAVVMILASTKVEKPERLKSWQDVIKFHKRSYWSQNPREAEKIFKRLRKAGKIIQPRVRGIEPPKADYGCHLVLEWSYPEESVSIED